MDKVDLKYGDAIIVDPCYIKNVKDFTDTTRFDALKLSKVMLEGSDGEYEVLYRYGEENYGHYGTLGVDSGRLWLMTAEFDVEIEIDAGLSGYKIVRGNEMKQLNPQNFTVAEMGDY